ncbi:MAG TPA: OmpA family protein, partial [Bacteroidia bacterium]|nr:OmpA family protein [Bacteroidia bacterium]
PGVKLEVISHTDSRGDDASNLALSEKRSKAVVDYLASKGIDNSRLTPTGKGEAQIKNRCLNGVECSDKEHELNRRTEFNFLKN